MTDFNQGIEMKSILTKYRIYFEGTYTPEQIIYGIHEHCKRSNVIPRVSDVLAVVDPKPQRISVGEYLQAKKDYEKNGFNEFTPEGMLVKQYDKQREEDRRQSMEKDQIIQAIAQNTLKRLT